VETESSSQHSQDSVTCRSQEPDQSSPRASILIL